jgi:hypothetical protein
MSLLDLIEEEEREMKSTRIRAYVPLSDERSKKDFAKRLKKYTIEEKERMLKTLEKSMYMVMG